MTEERSAWDLGSKGFLAIQTCGGRLRTIPYFMELDVDRLTTRMSGMMVVILDSRQGSKSRKMPASTLRIYTEKFL